MSTRSSRWCFTINNPQPVDHALLVRLGASTKYLVFGRETGDSGTFHFQGFVIFQHAKALAPVRAALGGRAHCEIARGNNKQASDYCKKENDYEEYGELPTGTKGVGATWERFRDYVRALDYPPTDTELVNEFPGLFAQYYDGCQRIISLLHPRVRPVDGDYRLGWQTELRDDLAGTADDRTITFIVDPDGDKGKTWFVQKFRMTHIEKTQVLGAGATKDLAYLLKESKSIFLFDIPRGNMEFISYNLLESLKNGYIVSTKYQTKEKWWTENNHVVVFCNEYPDQSKLSEDRFDIRTI